MKSIKNVVFDFGGVLVDWNPHHLYDKYFGSEEKATWFLENICLYSWNLQMDKGKPFAEGIAELQAQHPEWSEAIEIYHSRWIEMMGGEVEGTGDVLLRLKAAGYRIYGLSNWSMETFPLVRDQYPIFKELEGIDIYPAPAVALSTLIKMVENNTIDKDACIMLNITGAGEEAAMQGREVWYLKPHKVFSLTPEVDDVVATVEAMFA